MRDNRYALFVDDERSTASVGSLIDGVMLAKLCARERPGVEHTVTIDGQDYARYTLRADGRMEVWLR